MSPEVIAVFGGKGGIGKTTTAVNLSHLLGADGHKTLLVDANVDQPSAHDLYEGLRHDPPYDLTVEENPALLAEIKRVSYRYVVIDCPPSPREAQGAFEAADIVVVPFVPKFLETKAIARTIKDTLRGLPHRILFVAVSRSMLGRAEQSRASLAGFGVPLFDTHVRHYAAHEKAQSNGLPVFLEEARSLDPHIGDAAEDYRKVYAELQGYLGGRR